ncbi:uncharacterized protein F4812DRAFT_444358 [Daldinia caldariorum]|uniref:uncharacterized protein n=1 Tax=Daldinia caldariorum TaxID=326644 RepID=UPI002008D354|nr:uncharacterized protein F4812DRAFT_444358 [Daldinia caldariorum]KAI1464054.1 hypothetical protein F4812DRAFT_444358 [Daldinia caldariorum]
MVRTRKGNLSVEDSWRMVDGSENDSFDTTVIQDPFDDNPIIFSSQSQQSQLTSSSQAQSIASQDSIRDFANNADEDNVILRAPFQPSLASTRNTSMDKDLTPVPEFFMPTVEVDSQQGSSRRSSRSAHPMINASHFVKRRGNRRESDTTARQSQHKPNELPREPTLLERFTGSIPGFLFDLAAWLLGIFRLAFRYAQWPLAILLAVYLIIGAGIMAKNMIISSVSAPLAPLCRIPGVSLANLPFCAKDSPSGQRDGSSVVEFDELMNVQAQFEKVLEDSAQGVSLPMDMKRSEASVRDLRTMVKYSELPTRAELVHEFDNYIEIVRAGANGLQMFNTHVGGAVDSIISINRWTSRYIDSIAMNREAHNNMLSRFSDWVFSPFQVSVFDERALLEKYVEHTALVSDKIANLIVEAQGIMRILSEAENSLEVINEHVVRTNNVVKEKHDEVFWDIWTLVGANHRRLHNLKAQLGLLQQVDTQRNSAVQRLDSLVHDLYDIQTKLSDLRDRVAAPELLADYSTIPLAVHIETINAGVERLESARSRIRAEENERLRQALQRSREDDHLIDG